MSIIFSDNYIINKNRRFIFKFFNYKGDTRGKIKRLVTETIKKIVKSRLLCKMLYNVLPFLLIKIDVFS